jgi:hypothetical protein
MATTRHPAYKRGFSISRDFSATYFSRVIIRPDIERALGSRLEYDRRGRPKFPRMLTWQQQQLSRLMSRAVQMSRRVTELEQFVKARIDKGIEEDAAITGQHLSVPVVIAMTPDELARWQYCQEASTRAELAAAKLRKELREELEHIQSAGHQDLVAAMARAEEPPADDPPDEEPPPPPVKEPGPEPPPAKSGESED